MNSEKSKRKRIKKETKLSMDKIFKKHSVYNLIILDESGSMESIKSSIISGFNEVIISIKGIETKFPEQKHYVSFVTFNGLGIRTTLDIQPVKKINKIDENTYHPDSMTPLYDAIGLSINKLRTHLTDKKDYNVLVTILTDGLENVSKEFTGIQIKEIVENLKVNGWSFTYIGTGHEIGKAAAAISITNTVFFERSQDSINKMFVAEKTSREDYCDQLRVKKVL
jgi:Mg-chelatase subunit ChlD